MRKLENTKLKEEIEKMYKFLREKKLIIGFEVKKVNMFFEDSYKNYNYYNTIFQIRKYTTIEINNYEDGQCFNLFVNKKNQQVNSNIVDFILDFEYFLIENNLPF